MMRPRLFRLLEMHQRLDDGLQQELRRPRPDPFRVVRLKKLKLRVKGLFHGLIRRPKSV